MRHASVVALKRADFTDFSELRLTRSSTATGDSGAASIPRASASIASSNLFPAMLGPFVFAPRVHDD